MLGKPGRFFEKKKVYDSLSEYFSQFADFVLPEKNEPKERRQTETIGLFTLKWKYPGSTILK
ncbi:hypothetical protein DLM75_04575 [Leptospira stimsonii]|uniref:Uncharacterized protein n=1 Tax=Leptospira stimsonii TaxID=2202203 RepID=A0A396ZG46_9LEPT|nr:hypothetical protein DLM75_04575 [Leptospira stimsonii]